jgi:hypothetical protein
MFPSPPNIKNSIFCHSPLSERSLDVTSFPFIRNKAFLAVCTLLTVLLLSACTLEPITSYQGILTDAGGNPVADGTYSAEFRLYDVSTGGTALYTEARTLTVDGGLFDTTIGSSDVPTELYAEQLYLEVVIEGEVLTPRQALRGAPYAFSLASGAVVQAYEPLTRTFTVPGGNTYNSVGGGLYVGNVYAGFDGGSGIVAATGSESTLAAAVRGIATDLNSGGYGGRFDSETYVALRTATNDTSDYTANFFDGTGIYVEGNCTGCRVAEFAENVGSAPIAPGDFVAVEGVVMRNDMANPVLQVRRATGSADVIIGVAQYRANLPTLENEAAKLPAREEGDIRPGDVMLVNTTGLAQARIGEGVVAIGDYVTAGEDGLVVVAERDLSSNAPARVMSAPDANGMVWVMLGGQ